MVSAPVIDERLMPTRAGRWSSWDFALPEGPFGLGFCLLARVSKFWGSGSDAGSLPWHKPRLARRRRSRTPYECFPSVPGSDEDRDCRGYYAFGEVKLELYVDVWTEVRVDGAYPAACHGFSDAQASVSRDSLVHPGEVDVDTVNDPVVDGAQDRLGVGSVGSSWHRSPTTIRSLVPIGDRRENLERAGSARVVLAGGGFDLANRRTSASPHWADVGNARNLSMTE